MNTYQITADPSIIDSANRHYNQLKRSQEKIHTEAAVIIDVKTSIRYDYDGSVNQFREEGVWENFAGQLSFRLWNGNCKRKLR